MKREIRVSADAENDIENVLNWTYEHFGEHKFEEYVSLLDDALTEIAHNPNCPKARPRPDIHQDARTYHIQQEGKAARHFLLFRVTGKGAIEIDRLLYDGMDLHRNLPGFYERREP